METRVSVITLGVTSLNRTRRFYEHGLGWTVAQAEKEIVFFQLNGVILALSSWAKLAEDAGASSERSGFSGIALAYNTRSTEEVDSVLNQAAEAGGQIVKPGQEVFWGGYSGYFADLDGHLWEVAHNPFWRLDDKGNVSLGSV